MRFAGTVVGTFWLASCASSPPSQDPQAIQEELLGVFRDRADSVFEQTSSCRADAVRRLRAFVLNREDAGRLAQARDVGEALDLLRGVSPNEFSAAHAELRDYGVHLLRERALGEEPAAITKRIFEITSVAYVVKDCPLYETARLFTLVLRSHPKPGWPKDRRREIYDAARNFVRAEPFDSTGFVLAAEVADALAFSSLVKKDPKVRAQIRRIAAESRIRVREAADQKWLAYPPRIRTLMEELREAVSDLKFVNAWDSRPRRGRNSAFYRSGVRSPS